MTGKQLCRYLQNLATMTAEPDSDGGDSSSQGDVIYLDAGAREVLSGARLEILEYLAMNDPGSISDLADGLDRRTDSVVRDLRYLERHDLIGREHVGPTSTKRPYLKFSMAFIGPLYPPDIDD